MTEKFTTNHSSTVPGVNIDPNAIYDATDCLKILGLRSRSSLRRYVDKGFPLKPVGTGRALGSEILDWLRRQITAKQTRGAGSRKGRPGRPRSSVGAR